MKLPIATLLPLGCAALSVAARGPVATAPVATTDTPDPASGPAAPSGREPREGDILPFSSDVWTISAEEARIEDVDGFESLTLRNGTALLRDLEAVDGVLEVDLFVTSARGFSGVLWRARDDDYEHFYVRPHLSGLADASQYTPVCNGVSGWQLYSGPAYTAPVELTFARWMHLRVEFLGDRAQVFLDSETPVLVIDDLGLEAGPGTIGVSSSFAPARFANFRFTATSELAIRPATHPVEALAPLRSAEGPGALVESWSVSDAVDEASLAGRDTLGTLPADLAWHALGLEPNGIANLARLQGVRPGANTALARLELEADAPTTQRIDFGFSDRVRVYHDGRLRFLADDGYRTRDYRFLGTVGLHDSLLLDLHQGRNVLTFAVSESFGGWGITASLAPRGGVRVVEPEAAGR